MRLQPHARIGVIGAGPGGLAAAKHALEAGFDVSVFEAGDDLGGQWNATAAYSGVWPGMHTNTSRSLTAFSDFPHSPDLPLHPEARQVQEYLRAYSDHFGVTSTIRFGVRVDRLEVDRLVPRAQQDTRTAHPGDLAGWRIDGEPFDAVVIASGRFRKPRFPSHLGSFGGELLHAFDYPGAEAFTDRRTLVYGNGISGHEIASDIATVAPVVSAYRKPRYVLQKVVDGVSSDWQWYTQFGAWQREALPANEFGRILRDQVLRVAGNPADHGAPAPDPDIMIAGHSLSQDYLSQVSLGAITCRPTVASVEGRTVTYIDGQRETVEAIVCATGYDLDLPYLSHDLRRALCQPGDLGDELCLYNNTLPPGLPSLGVVGQFLAQGPYFPLLELQARWVVGIWAGDIPRPDVARMRFDAARPRARVHPLNVFATTLAHELGVTPVLAARPELAEALIFGPMLPPRYRLDGPGRNANAVELFRGQLEASPRPPVQRADLEALRRIGRGDAADLLSSPGAG